MPQHSIDISNFDYDLPENTIAKYPLPNRDKSKLLIYKNSKITIDEFTHLANAIPGDALLVFNDAKVIRARLHFKRKTGAAIEVFLLEPFANTMEEALQKTEYVYWQVMVGNKKKWHKEETVFLQKDDLKMHAEWHDKAKNIVKLSWQDTGNSAFAAVLQKAGTLPIPPYLKRKAKPLDNTSYQTLFAQTEGAVAAPTAALHFTDAVMQKIRKKKISTAGLTLHVGAGTFLPVTRQNMAMHKMHREFFSVSTTLVELLIKKDTIVATGTTCMRTLETLYLIGVKILIMPHKHDKKTGCNVFIISQEEATQLQNSTISKKVALNAILEYCKANAINTIQGHTSIYILPGFKFRVCSGLITNFHLPKSTLLLLVSAFVGDDWKTIYKKALQNNFRFLSYGDGSILLPGNF